ncbi:hypothetical protein CTRG_00434 [Candida tropicalis MYA-3404]|uniref:Reticulon-like protein n=1 Tax=Candida tropicalis (strain ATCC MYA-3404 / T1) TaxID=294747 RepID=C5M2Z5_CANTT|nr:hypothetical protein CTRG_00434 [Candida tropicalis MYA-3404]EER35695.1 hypothetical protein CTRG_00434 [Candida tropicalis MYA-3404]KAG4409805.1 hypothetical protein JTP64_000443 [Candida tropicalis]
MSASIPNTSSSIPSESIPSSNSASTASSHPVISGNSGETCPYHSAGSSCDLLTWKNPIKTGKIFGAIIFGLIIFKTVNLFNIFFHLAYIGLLVSAAAEYSGKLITGKGFLSNFKYPNKFSAKKFNDQVLPELARINVHFEESLNRIVYAHDIETTLKAAGLSYVLYKLTSWFSLYVLIFVSVILVFTVPFIYTTYKKEIDAAVSDATKIVKSKTTEYTEKAHKAAGPHIENLIQKTGPVGAFVKSKIPVRTAGSTVGESRATSYGTDADNKINTSTATQASEPITTAHTTGASQFPDVPTSNLHSSSVQEVADKVAADVDEFADSTEESFKPTLN